MATRRMFLFGGLAAAALAASGTACAAAHCGPEMMIFASNHLARAKSAPRAQSGTYGVPRPDYRSYGGWGRW